MMDFDRELGEHKIMISTLDSTSKTLFGKLDKLAEDGSVQLKSIAKDIQGLCIEVKGLKRDIGGITSEQSRIRDEVEEVSVQPPQPANISMENEPVGWINSAIKKVLKSPAFWILFGWFIIKTFIFGEYPSFIKQDRPYMKQAQERSLSVPQPAVAPSDQKDGE
jgi:hypothetical protein